MNKIERGLTRIQKPLTWFFWKTNIFPYARRYWKTRYFDLVNDLIQSLDVPKEGKE